MTTVINETSSPAKQDSALSSEGVPSGTQTFPNFSAPLSPDPVPVQAEALASAPLDSIAAGIAAPFLANVEGRAPETNAQSSVSPVPHNVSSASIRDPLNRQQATGMIAVPPKNEIPQWLIFMAQRPLVFLASSSAFATILALLVSVSVNKLFPIEEREDYKAFIVQLNAKETELNSKEAALNARQQNLDQAKQDFEEAKKAEARRAAAIQRANSQAKKGQERTSPLQKVASLAESYGFTGIIDPENQIKIKGDNASFTGVVLEGTKIVDLDFSGKPKVGIGGGAAKLEGPFPGNFTINLKTGQFTYKAANETVIKRLPGQVDFKGDFSQPLYKKIREVITAPLVPSNSEPHRAP